MECNSLKLDGVDYRGQDYTIRRNCYKTCANMVLERLSFAIIKNDIWIRKFAIAQRMLFFTCHCLFQ